MKNINVLIIGTHKKYYDFALDLIESINKYFFVNHNVKIFLFTDLKDPKIKNVKNIHINHKPWPGSTLMRYHIFLDHVEEIKKCDYLFYIDADMKIIKPIGEEILSDMISVMHVGYYDKPRKDFIYERSEFSDAYIPYNCGDMYYHATFIGGSFNKMINMFKFIRECTDNDINKGFFPIYHDESFYNRALYLNPPTKILDPGYAYFYHWKNNAPFEPKIINVNKNEANDVVDLHGEQSNFLYNEIVKRLNVNKYDLSDTTIVFFVNIFTEKNYKNLTTIIKYISKYFICKFLVVEINNEESYNINGVNKLFIHSNNFDIINNIHKVTESINTEYVIYHGIDDVIQLDSYINSRYCVQNDIYDVMYLHNGVNIKLDDVNTKSFSNNISIEGINISHNIMYHKYNSLYPKNQLPYFPFITRRGFIDDIRCDLQIYDINDTCVYLDKYLYRNKYRVHNNFQFHIELLNDKNYDVVSSSKLCEYFSKNIVILMVTHNNIDTIRISLDSLYRQVFKNFKVLIFDRFSTDYTYQVLKEYESKHDNLKCIRYYKEISELDSIKMLFNLVDPNCTDYVMFNDPSCMSYDYKTKLLFDELEKNDNYDAVGSFMNNVKDGYINSECLYKRLHDNFNKKDLLDINSTIFRYSSAKDILSVNNSKCYDYEFWYNFLTSGKNVHNIPYVLTDRQTSKNNNDNDRKYLKIKYDNYLNNIPSKRFKVGLIIIATNKYVDMAKNLIESVNKYFLKRHDVKIFLFTNNIDFFTELDNVTTIYQDHYSWPCITLFRYKIIDEHKYLFKDMDYLYYMDSDYLCVDYVNEEIFGNLVGCNHPFLFRSDRSSFTYETNKESLAYIPPNEGTVYYHGAFQGGTTRYFLQMCETLKTNISKDFDNKIIATWWDESHLNRYFIDNEPDVVLDPSYSFVNNENTKILSPKIVVVNKDNNLIRSDTYVDFDTNCKFRANYEFSKIKPFISNSKDIEDLKDFTFIIPVNIEYKDDLENIRLVIDYIKTYYDTNIIIGDYSKNSVVEKDLKDKVNYIYDGNIKHRSEIVNKVIDIVDTDKICIYYPEYILTKNNVMSSVDLIRNDHYVVIPNNGVCKRIPRSYYSIINRTKMAELFNNNYIDMSNEEYSKNGCIFIKSNIYKNIGMENEDIMDYTECDNDRFNRFKKYKYCYLDEDKFLYMLNHFKTKKSW